MNNVGLTVRLVVAATPLLLLAPARAQHVAEVIYTNLAKDPSSMVPGTDERFRSPLVPFLDLAGSPDGQHWIFKAFTDNADSNLNDVIVAGSGTTGAAVAKEGDPAPGTAFTYGFFDSDCGVNDSGDYAFGNRLSGGAPTSADENIYSSFGGLAIAVLEGDLAPGLVDPSGPTGDEIFGNSLNSTHILNDGTVCFKADLIDNVDSDYESALYQGMTPVAQEGTSLATLLGTDVYDSFTGLSGDTFSSSADGSSWIVEADVAAGISTVEAVVVNDAIQLRDGDVLPGGSLAVDAVFSVDMGGGGDWYARGDYVGDDDWAVRNGVLVAESGNPITNDFPGELSGASFSTLTGNTAGDWILVSDTDNPDATANQVVVLNCSRVIARKGDPIDLNGNGLPDDGLFLGAISANDVVLTDDLTDDLVDDRYIYLFAEIRDEANTDLGDAFVRIPLDICLGDTNDDGQVNVDDLVEVITKWGQSCVAADIDSSGEVSVDDLVAVITYWGECP